MFEMETSAAELQRSALFSVREVSSEVTKLADRTEVFKGSKADS